MLMVSTSSSVIERWPDARQQQERHTGQQDGYTHPGSYSGIRQTGPEHVETDRAEEQGHQGVKWNGEWPFHLRLLSAQNEERKTHHQEEEPEHGGGVFDHCGEAAACECA